MILKRSLLLPEYGIWLSHDGGGEEFTKLFQECWQQIPDSDRGRLLAHWMNSGIKTYPMIELSTLWSDSQSCFTQVTLGGMEIRYNSDHFRHFPKGVARWIIAHELAHVFQKTEGKSPGGDDERRNENDADEIVERWGFEKTAWILLRVNLSGGKSFEASCQLVRQTMKE